MIFIGFMHVNYRLDLFAYPGTPCTIMIQGVIEAIIVNIEDNIWLWPHLPIVSMNHYSACVPYYWLKLHRKYKVPDSVYTVGFFWIGKS